MQRILSLDEIGRDIAKLKEQKASAERQIEALSSAQMKLWVENTPAWVDNSKGRYALGPAGRVIADTIYEILKEEHPLHLRTIVQRVVERGVVIKAAKPEKQVGTALRLDDRFERAYDEMGLQPGFNIRYWTLTDFCRNDLQDNVQWNQEVQILNETAEGSLPSTASNQKEGVFPMVTINDTTKSQTDSGKKAKNPILITALGPDDPDDGDLGRQRRGLAIAATVPITPTKIGYSVPSQSGKGKYVVSRDDEDNPYCSCDDFELRNAPCKHIYAVEFSTTQDEDSSVTPAIATSATKKACGRDWTAYDAAQTNEQEKFGILLRKLADTVPQPAQCNGRPRLLLSDMVYAIGLKVYSTVSTRRAMPDVRDAADKGQLDKTPSFPTIVRYLQKPELTPVLEALIEESALPLKDLEVDFAADSSGFSTSVYDRWFDHKWGRPVRTAHFVKAHITCGVQSNIITTAKVTAGQSSDSRQLPEMVKATARNFTIREFSADKAYLSRENLRVIDEAGGTPFIPFKANSVAHSGHHKRDALWERLFYHFQIHREEFLKHYHKRSNVETCFSMIKAKFGASVRSKSDTAQVNEVLVKILCHNIAVLVQAMYKLGIDPEW